MTLGAPANIGLVLRPGTPADAGPCGQICHDAFASISRAHNFPKDFPNPEAATGLLSWMLARNDVFSVIAEHAGKIVGSNFLWESDHVGGVGPITVEPQTQDSSIGRRLMEAVLQRASQRNFASVRLVQAAYHSRSLSLYTKLGFDAREMLATMQGPALNVSIPARTARPAHHDDIEACNQLCIRIHGHQRGTELAGGIEGKTAMVVEHAGRITGYASSIGFFGHAVGESNDDLKALIGAAKEISGPGFLLPVRNGELFRWCLAHQLRVVHTATLMSIGLYSHPNGAFLPSILY